MNTTQDIVLIGLTGQSGAGKSTVAEILREHGMSFINCDEVAREVSAIPAFLTEVAELFPTCVENGALKRQELAAIVFNDPTLLNKYNSLIFPYITADIFRRIRQLKNDGSRYIILDAPTLFESDIHLLCSCIISVIAPFDLKVRRILERDGIPVDLVTSRINAQHGEDFFKTRSDFVINNDGDIDALKISVDVLVREIRERFNA